MIEGDLKRIEKDAVKSWIIGRMIFSIIFLAIVWGLWYLFSNKLEGIKVFYIGVFVICILLTTFLVLNTLVFPFIEYSEWRYKIDMDKIVYKDGIFIKSEVTIPISRIQNVVVEYGPIYKRFGLVKLGIVTASGSHEIPAIKKEEGEILAERLKNIIEEGGRFEY